MLQRLRRLRAHRGCAIVLIIVMTAFLLVSRLF